MLAIDGFVSARRWQTDEESFVTLYEIDTEGRMSKPVAVETSRRR